MTLSPAQIEDLDRQEASMTSDELASWRRHLDGWAAKQAELGAEQTHPRSKQQFHDAAQAVVTTLEERMPEPGELGYDVRMAVLAVVVVEFIRHAGGDPGEDE